MSAKDAAELATERAQLDSGGCIVGVRGQIDLYSAPEFKSALANAVDDGCLDLVVDLSEVNFMDSTGLGVLVGMLKRLDRAGGTLTIVTSDPTILRIFEISGLTDRFTIVASRAEL